MYNWCVHSTHMYAHTVRSTLYSTMVVYSLSTYVYININTYSHTILCIYLRTYIHVCELHTYVYPCCRCAYSVHMYTCTYVHNMYSKQLYLRTSCTELSTGSQLSSGTSGNCSILFKRNFQIIQQGCGTHDRETTSSLDQQTNCIQYKTICHSWE